MKKKYHITVELVLNDWERLEEFIDFKYDVPKTDICSIGTSRVTKVELISLEKEEI